ncbi:MAG: peptidylprolyl isomerase, partial [Pyrinomonadaceae bacterium]
MNSLGKTLTVLVIMLAIGAGLVFWKSKHPDAGGGALTTLTKEDMKFLLEDENPMLLKRIAEDPEIKQKYIESKQQFLAVASEARKEGFADNPKYKPFLDFVRAQIIAVNYDKEKNKDKGSLPPFSFIKKDEVDAFYQKPGNEEDFNKLVETIKEQGKEEAPNDPGPTPAQLEQLKEVYAKVKIYENSAEAEKAQLGADFWKKTDFQIQFQQAALLNQIFAQKVLAKKVEVTDDEVKAYITAHPELDPAAKKAKAEEILKRAKSGEDFAKLANEASEDPGNKDPQTGELKGGLYKDFKPGSGFDKTFEETALSLQPGQIADNVVETPFGYHIIKLERKGPSKDKDGKDLGETYDVRHILISTMFT